MKRACEAFGIPLKFNAEGSTIQQSWPCGFTWKRKQQEENKSNIHSLPTELGYKNFLKETYIQLYES
jgi:hypothetical protein